MAELLARNLSVCCAVRRLGRAICGKSRHGSPTAITSATSITAASPRPLSATMRGHHEHDFHYTLISPVVAVAKARYLGRTLFLCWVAAGAAIALLYLAPYPTIRTDSADQCPGRT